MNTSIVIALPKIEDAKKIRTVLNRYGFTVAAVCNSGANALMASQGVISEAPPSVLCVGMPLKAGDLVNTVSMILSQIERRWKKDKKKPKQRSWKEQNYISNAKMLLMERNHLSEEDAYRYIQKCSMDSGTNMVETAQMVLMLLYDSV